MGNSPTTYKTINYLSSFLVKKKALRQQDDLTRTVTLKEIEEDLAQHCSLSRNAIIAIKRGERLPSLTVALLIAKFFEVSIEEIFVLKQVEDIENSESENPKEEIVHE